MPSSPLSEYLIQIGRIPLLTAAEEISLGHAVQKMIRLKESLEPDKKLTMAERRIIRSGERARERMIKANLRLVIAISKKYVQLAINLEQLDLIQEGNIGLARAVEKFDPERGYKFSTYAFWWVRQAITRGISQQDRIIKLPSNAQDVLRNLRNMTPKYQVEFGRPPTIEEASKELGLQPSALREYLTHALDATSTDRTAQHADGPGACIADILASDEPTPLEEAEVRERHEMVRSALHGLSDQKREIIEMCFGFHGEQATLQQIGKLQGCSRERIRQRREQGMVALRRTIAMSLPKKNWAQPGSTNSTSSWGKAA